VSEAHGQDLFDVDYHAVADRSVEEVCAMLGIPRKSGGALEGGSAGAFDLAGMSEIQRRFVEQRQGEAT
jgi:hypothetical protein